MSAETVSKLKREVTALEVRVWRGNASGGGFSTYRVPAQENQTILDVVTWIQQNAEPTLAYRFACRVGMCGSCAMMVNSKPRWTCRTHVKRVAEDGRLEIAPLRNLPVIKDLAADLSEFFDKWTQAEGAFRPTATREDGIAVISPDDPRRELANAAIECINCAACYAACDTVSANPEYLAGGPQPGLDIAERRTRRRLRPKTGGGVGRSGLLQLPHAPELHGLLPERTEPDGVDCGLEADHCVVLPPGRARTMIGIRLYLLQRLSAIIMVPLVIGHIAVMIYAVQNGLSASEILARTQGSLLWGTTYSLFVLAVSIHAAIGVRAVLSETFRISARWLDILTWSLGLVLFFMGARAVCAVVLP